MIDEAKRKKDRLIGVFDNCYAISVGYVRKCFERRLLYSNDLSRDGFATRIVGDSKEEHCTLCLIRRIGGLYRYGNCKDG